MNSFLEGILYKVNPNRFDQIRRTATGFASNYVGSNIIQDDIFSLIENYARAKEMPLEWIRLPIDDQELCACTFIRGGRIFVMINSKLPYSKQIFAAAHELYHIWCYLEDNDTELIRTGSILDARTIDVGTTEAEEMEANAFAGALLVPLDSLNQQMRIYQVNSSDPGVDEILTLMDIFAVPYKAMVLRLVEENKISDEKAIDLLNISGEDIQKRISVTGKSKRWSLAPVGTEKLGSIIENLSDNTEAERLPDERLKRDGLKLEQIMERYGKKKSKYLDDSTAAELSELIEKRRNLEKELRELKKQLPKQKRTTIEDAYTFKADVLIGKALKPLAESVRGFERRSCYAELENFLERNYPGKVFILYGLRRTGITTLIRQAIASLSERDFDRAAFIQVKPGITLGEINTDLRWLRDHGYQYVFIDEITLAEDFIEGAALLSDIYAASGIKIVLSGTDSLGFLLSESEELYDRCILLHTTWIPYREFERVLNIKGIDEYIRYGGTMSLGGKHYNEPVTFKTRKSTDEYIDSAIARNIQHSLRFYQDGGHFRHLADLYEKNELTSAINRVIEDINHRFTLEVLTNDFKSHDLGISKRNLRKDRENPTDILDRIDERTFVDGLRKALEILNQNEQSDRITDAHRIEIKEYLDLLDLTVDIPTEFIPVKDEKSYRTVVSQPGLRYSQAEALVRQLLLNKEFQNISAVERAAILERILNEIRGRMMEEIILLETKMAYPEKQVFRLQFAIGEFDMVVVDPVAITTEIYEIKHSAEKVPEQYKNLTDKEKCRETEFRFGAIMKKVVIYRGGDDVDGDILYLNVENYLRSLGV